MTPRWAEVFRSNDDEGRSSLQAAATCDNCGHASLALASEFVVGGSTYAEYFDRTPGELMEWFPRAGSAPRFVDVPEHIARAAGEAHSAYSISAYMAAILMARTVVEATAKEKGYNQGSLLAKIDDLAAGNIIRSGTRDAAHEIRHLGNDMAHGDITDIPDSDDVADVLALMDEVINEVFQGPAKTARLRARRNSGQD